MYKIIERNKKYGFYHVSIRNTQLFDITVFVSSLRAVNAGTANIQNNELVYFRREYSDIYDEVVYIRRDVMKFTNSDFQRIDDFVLRTDIENIRKILDTKFFSLTLFYEDVFLHELTITIPNDKVDIANKNLANIDEYVVITQNTKRILHRDVIKAVADVVNSKKQFIYVFESKENIDNLHNLSKTYKESKMSYDELKEQASMEIVV